MFITILLAAAATGAIMMIYGSIIAEVGGGFKAGAHYVRTGFAIAAISLAVLLAISI